MKGVTFAIVIGIMGLGLFGLTYVVFDHVYQTNIQTFAASSIIDGNQTAYQTLYSYTWNAAPPLIVLAFLFFLIVWAQRRSIEEI